MTSMDAYVTETLRAAIAQARSVAPDASVAVAPHLDAEGDEPAEAASVYVNCGDEGLRERAADAVTALHGLGAGAVTILDEVMQGAGLALGLVDVAGVRVFVWDDERGVTFALDVSDSPGCGCYPPGNQCDACEDMQMAMLDEGAPTWRVTAGTVSELLALMSEKAATWRGEVRPAWEIFMLRGAPPGAT